MRRLTPLLAALLLAPAALRAQRCTVPDTLSPPPRTALVLSGGGAKGLAHIGVLRTLDSLGIRPDLVVGTSMGAIVGALYASGYSAAEIDSIARTLPLDRLIHAYEPVALRSLDYLQPLVVWQQGERGFNLQPQSVRDPEMNALISALLLRGNLLARGDFDRLPIPFRAVATDLATRTPVVLSSGDLARAVRASFAIPLIFAPERIDGRVLGDGALSANVPVAAARAAGATRVIVSDITSGAADSLGLDAPLTLASHLIGFLFQQPPDSLTRDDVRIRSELRAFADLDFSPDNVTRLVDEGHRAANAVLRASACPAAPLPRPAPVPTHLARFTVSGGRRADVRVLRNLLGLATSDTIDVRRMQRLLLRLGESERYVGVWLTPRGGGDSVSLDLAVQGAPRRTAGVGLAYDQELGGRAWLGLVDRRLFGRNVEGSAVLRVGSLRQDLELGARREYLLGQLVRPIMTLDIANEDVRRFDADGNELDPSVVREASAFLGLERAIFGGWTSRFGARGIAWHDTSRVHGRAVGGVLRVLQVSRSGERLIDAGAEWNTEYARVAIDGAEPAQVGKLEIRPRVRVGWGSALPLQATFPLGGSDGFPGLHLGERRGDREAFASTLLTYPFVGPVLIRIELAGGSTAMGGTALPGRGWLFGARGGLGLETPVGPVHADYGYNSLHRGAVVVRVGRWF